MNDLAIHRIATVCLSLVVFGCFFAQLRSTSVSEPRFHLQGTVIDATSGTRLEHATVTISLAGDSEALNRVVTDDSGRFDFENLANGKYKLTAECHGYLTEAYDQHDQY